MLGKAYQATHILIINCVIIITDASVDVIEEAFNYFKPNMFFSSFEIEGTADRVLIYLTLFIRECIVKSQRCANAKEAEKTLNTFALSNFSMPGDGHFTLGTMYPAPADKGEADLLKQYITQLRVETAQRFVKKAFKDNAPDKWWFCFAKRKFLNKTID
ncbi:hypothetical protein SARC_02248 [Sphaeroforma arctica JP610]|uniref:Actin-related protein 2/3 complex subunit 3 n=1 Tax=Sphaeroforma arctica JP610 TaxID=667725 RepID=A0A0L0G9A3_9EUKA|nr:hypothetical protein SARC_02248 [Sphaeroforma arctica JP610]KNC85592.1 hypothetical protein SARC_02248 [Sphaeroforma arctica JP610]|eukprot:XP_014159494.1 hypothetical protein SARC_02248 [Sphaeroforma arctica JP610]